MFSCNLSKLPEFDPNIKTCALSQEFLRQNPEWAKVIQKYKIFNILEPNAVQTQGEQRGQASRGGNKDTVQR